MFRTLLSLFSLWLFVTLIPMEASATSKHLINVLVDSGDYLAIDVYDYKNARGQRELRFETHNKAKVLLGYGRDLDGDAEVETFFIFGEGGINRYTQDSKRLNSLDRARVVLFRHAKYSGKDYFAGVATNILTFIFFAVDHVYEAQKTFYQDWMDLEELWMAIEANKSQLSREELRYALQLFSEGGQLSLERFEKALSGEYWAMWGVDAAIWISGAVVLKWAGLAVRAVAKKVAPRLMALGVSAAARLGLRLTLKTYQANVHVAIKAISGHVAMAKSKSAIARGVIAGTRKIRSEWAFIALSLATQIAVESYVKIDEIKGATPADTATNLMNHPGIKENVTIGLMDSILMTGATALSKNKIARFAMLGVIGGGTSLGAGHLLEGEQSSERLMFDTSWAAGADSAQLLLELKVIHKFKALARLHKNPRLRLVGYSIMVVSQAVGYYGYSKAAQYIDPPENLENAEVHLVPILASVE